jgi:hypothetical protein
MRVTETALWLEWVNWAEPILAEPFRISGGQLEILDKPGVGIEWDQKAIERYRLSSDQSAPSRRILTTLWWVLMCRWRIAAAMPAV